MDIQWFPGHMAKAQRVIKEQMKVIDVVIELRDARIPASSENPLLHEVITGKPRVIVLNKADMADPMCSRAWKRFFNSSGEDVVLLNSKLNSSRKELIASVLKKGAPFLDRWKRRGLRTRSLRTIILGIPNVGKSTLINMLAKGYVAQTANRPGKTRGQQWVKLSENLELMDTPGVLWPKFEDLEAARRLAITGAIADEIFDAEEVVDRFVNYLMEIYPTALEKRYSGDGTPSSSAEWLVRIAQRRSCLLPGGEWDIEKARKIVIQDFRNGKLGKITLEMPEK